MHTLDFCEGALYFLRSIANCGESRMYITTAMWQNRPYSLQVKETMKTIRSFYLPLCYIE